MPKSILIKVGNTKIKAELNNSKTAQAVYDKLPIEGKVNLWGEEIYFTIPVVANLEEGFTKDIVELGNLGYWPEGRAFCIFFGQTPISTPSEIRPASSVNVVGKLIGDYEVLKKSKDNEKIVITS